MFFIVVVLPLLRWIKIYKTYNG